MCKRYDGKRHVRAVCHCMIGKDENDSWNTQMKTLSVEYREDYADNVDCKSEINSH